MSLTSLVSFQSWAVSWQEQGIPRPRRVAWWRRNEVAPGSPRHGERPTDQPKGAGTTPTEAEALPPLQQASRVMTRVDWCCNSVCISPILCVSGLSHNHPSGRPLKKRRSSVTRRTEKSSPRIVYSCTGLQDSSQAAPVKGGDCYGPWMRTNQKDI